MPAARNNLTIEQGATWRYPMALKAGGVDGPAMDLTGYGARMQIRAEVSAPLVLAELSTGNGRIAITPAAGQITLALTAAETAALDFDRAVYDIEIEDASGNVTRILQGTVLLSREVTR